MIDSAKVSTVTKNVNGKDRFYISYDGQEIGWEYVYKKERGVLRKVESFLGLAPSKPAKKEKVPRVKPVIEPFVPFAQPAPVVEMRQVFIPQRDATFTPFGDFKRVDTIIKSGHFFPSFITGPTGNGKSTMVEQACAKNKRGYIRINLNAQSDEDQLIGTKTLVDGNIEIVEGPVLIAMRQGAILLLDEIDAAEPNNIMCLQSILEGKPYYFKLKNEIITPTPGFNIFATGNTKGRGSDDGKYIGTKMLNEAFLERFPVTFEQDYPKPAIEFKIVKNFMEKFNCVNVKFAETLVKWADAIRKTYEEGAIDDIITTRRLIQIVQSYSIFGDHELAVQMACSRFDSLTKQTFIEVFDKIYPDDTPIMEEEIPYDDSAPF